MESKYRFLLWNLIAAADTGKFDNITVDEVHRHAAAETIPAFLKDRLGDELDLSMMDHAAWAELTETWFSISNATDYSRKFGVQNRGICLLMAYTLQSIQMLTREKQAA